MPHITPLSEPSTSTNSCQSVSITRGTPPFAHVPAPVNPPVWYHHWPSPPARITKMIPHPPATNRHTRCCASTAIRTSPPGPPPRRPGHPGPAPPAPRRATTCAAATRPPLASPPFTPSDNVAVCHLCDRLNCIDIQSGLAMGSAVQRPRRYYDRRCVAATTERPQGPIQPASEQEPNCPTGKLFVDIRRYIRGGRDTDGPRTASSPDRHTPPPVECRRHASRSAGAEDVVRSTSTRGSTVIR